MINIRKVGEVADGSVTASKLADGAVDLSTAKVTGELPSGKLANGAVIEEKLGDLAISTSKLQDNVVTLAKAADDTKLSHFTGDETEVNVTGDSEIDVKGFEFPKVGGKYAPVKIRIIAALKTNNASYTATLNMYVNAEGTPRLTLTSTTDSDYEMVSGEVDLSDLSSGKHSITFKMKSSDAAGIAYNELIDVLMVKG